MVNFILNEAKDKAEEIESSAIEDFNVQKMTLFQQRKDEISIKLTKKINNLKLEKIRAQNAGSREINDRVLRHQCAIVDNITKDALERIKEHVGDSNEYKRILALLILKGTMSLASTDLLVRCRQEDTPLIECSIAEAKSRFAMLTHELLGVQLELTASLDTKNFLASDIYGVVMTTKDGKVECNSTLNCRLDAFCEKFIPKIKAELFKARSH
ncbi:ATP synthase subunit E containing protein [Babesia divergens]|uniref:ATP synthase subunit E containing protein n=1 Tax=Babesia divergens TaxID=32595 RepID=A0AAD9LIP1_BABDI|nr:ATP synthase subunit E containing protein [Babesia divergens]